MSIKLPFALAVACFACACLSVPLVDAGQRRDVDYGQTGPFAIQSYQELITLPSDTTECNNIECDMLLLVTQPSDLTRGPYPLAIFSPGFNTQPTLYTKIINHIASYGYVVVGLNPNETLFRDITHRKKGLFVPAGIDWAEGQNRDARSRLYQQVDSSAVFSFGHSLGGKSSYLGASLDTRRIAGVYTIDPVDCEPGCIFPDNSVCNYDFDYPSAAMNGGAIRPGTVMIVGAEFGGLRKSGPACAPVKCNHEWFFNQASSQQWNVLFLETGHTQYVDIVPPPAVDPCVQGSLPDATIKYLTQSLLVAWAEKTIRNQNIDDYLTGSWMKEQVDAGYLVPKVKVH
eukprot:TRINITY_DN1200_c0_g1_i1.p1 TRINITY_DN1200_c0_g1~~TRINITY_DN1200_c0_g1_i1.p1  ORF type:complete len:343 (-),score=66.48 TRINITY_DN1200_c0_g1_i1:291-1319(-)